MTGPDENITRMLEEAGTGDRAAMEALFPKVYDELRRLAAAHFREQNARHTLQPTALVHEAYVKLAAGSGSQIKDRQHFFMLASKVMRQILVDHARAKNAAKRQAPELPPTMVELDSTGSQNALDVLDLERALRKLAALDATKAGLVELRFFGGLTSEEAADVLGISRTQAARWWRMVRAWLSSELSDGASA